jgi:DNA-directed RNA polymerase specialized sigma subunit
MTDEDRLLKQFEPACREYTSRYQIPGYGTEDLVQEGRLAALRSIRAWEPAKGNSKLSSHVIRAILWRMGTLLRFHSYEKRDLNEQVSSLDAEMSGEEGFTLADALSGDDPWHGIDLKIACLQECKRPVEGAIIRRIWAGADLSGLSDRFGLSRARIYQIKDELMARLREEVMKSEGS